MSINEEFFFDLVFFEEISKHEQKETQIERVEIENSALQAKIERLQRQLDEVVKIETETAPSSEEL